MQGSRVAWGERRDERRRCLAAGPLAILTAAALAQDEVTLQLKWVTQAQFAGYYVALKQGFYEEEGLDVAVNQGGPDVAPPQVMAGGGADVMVDWMPSALAARERRGCRSSTSPSRSSRRA